MLFRSCGLAVTIAIVASGALSAAASVQYNLVPLGGNHYQYVYTITNNSPGGGAAIQLFDILFDTTLYQESSLKIVTPAGLQLNWSEDLLTSVPPAPALYDVLALRGGIPAGTMVSGFAVEFTYIGLGTPGPQPFQIYDPDTFQQLQKGQTSSGFGATVPAASTVSLILLGACLLLTVVYRMRRSRILI